MHAKCVFACILANSSFVTCIYLQILAQHIKTVLPGLRARISRSLVAVAKEHASYGEITESKACTSIWMCLLNYFIYCISIFLIVDNIQYVFDFHWLFFLNLSIFFFWSQIGRSGCSTIEYSLKILWRYLTIPTCWVLSSSSTFISFN